MDSSPMVRCLRCSLVITQPKNVDVLFKILKGKDNAAFDGFCSILEEHGYEYWSAKLQKKVSAICNILG